MKQRSLINLPCIIHSLEAASRCCEIGIGLYVSGSNYFDLVYLTLNISRYIQIHFIYADGQTIKQLRVNVTCFAVSPWLYLFVFRGEGLPTGVSVKLHHACNKKTHHRLGYSCHHGDISILHFRSLCCDVQRRANIKDFDIHTEHQVSPINLYPLKLNHLCFHPLEVVSRYRDPQLQAYKRLQTTKVVISRQRVKRWGHRVGLIWNYSESHSRKKAIHLPRHFNNLFR